jgi:hypothetical protein
VAAVAGLAGGLWRALGLPIHEGAVADAVTTTESGLLAKRDGNEQGGRGKLWHFALVLKPMVVGVRHKLCAAPSGA